jgi:ssDNA-binding Zn-finger/Zn-ribbon topoisomerase 1
MNELERLRALVYGGTCPDCQGFGPIKYGDSGTYPCPNLDCKDGRIPGIAERLQAIKPDSLAGLKKRDAIVADLRREEPTK